MVPGPGDSRGVAGLCVGTLSERLVNPWVYCVKLHDFSGVADNWLSRAKSGSYCGSGENGANLMYWAGRNLKSGIQCELCGRWFIMVVEM